MDKKWKIENKWMGEDSPVYIIAELSANHNQDFEIAVKSVEAAAAFGADAIKLQTYTADTITIDSDEEYFRISQGTLWDGQTLHGLYQQAYTPWEWQPKLKEIAEKNGLHCFSSPFDSTAVDFLEKMNVPAYKIASFEIADIPLIEYVASKGKPVIISTGIASEADIRRAMEACIRMGNHSVALLKCTSSYPAPVEEANLRTIEDMRTRFDCIVGLSDHTMGLAVPVAATALGAKIIEKHFILDRAMGGPDSQFSLEPSEFKLMCDTVRSTEKALGKVTYELSEKVAANKIFGRSLFAVKDIRKGEEFTRENVRSIRPAHGLPPRYLPSILGKQANRDIAYGTPLSADWISGFSTEME